MKKIFFNEDFVLCTKKMLIKISGNKARRKIEDEDKRLRLKGG
jgi:hypothetical protein